MNSADLILENANVITMDPACPQASLIAIKGDKITFVGNDANLPGPPRGNTRVIDCAGKTVIPGFIDAHCHLFSLIRKILTLDVSPENVRSIEDINKLIRDQANKTPEGQWISGTGYNEFYLSEQRHPTRYDLDKATISHPVIITHRSLHACVLNSTALSIVGINNYTEEQSGTRIERNKETGEPNGILYEMVGYIREHVMPSISSDELDRGAALANARFLSYGITSIQDVSPTNDIDRWYNLLRIKQNRLFLPRTTMMTGPDNFDGFRSSGFTSGCGDNDLRFLGIKIIPSESTGTLFPSAGQLEQMVLDYSRQDIPVAIHAVTDNMVSSVIRAFSNARAWLTDKQLHLRIEHCSECTPASLKKLTRLQPVIVSQPPFVYYNGDRYLKIIPAGSIPWLYRFRSLISAGITLAAGSDSPVTPFNPMVGLFAAITRQTTGNQLLNSGEAVPIYDAMKMYTINAALASQEEDIKGSLATGKLADVAILSANPLTTSPEKMKDIKVDMTLVGGEIAWDRSSM